MSKKCRCNGADIKSRKDKDIGDKKKSCRSGDSCRCKLIKTK